MEDGSNPSLQNNSWFEEYLDEGKKLKRDLTKYYAVLFNLRNKLKHNPKSKTVGYSVMMAEPFLFRNILIQPLEHTRILFDLASWKTIDINPIENYTQLSMWSYEIKKLEAFDPTFNALARMLYPSDIVLESPGKLSITESIQFDSETGLVFNEGKITKLRKSSDNYKLLKILAEQPNVIHSYQKISLVLGAPDGTVMNHRDIQIKFRDLKRQVGIRGSTTIVCNEGYMLRK